MKQFLKELRRREVFRTAGLYVGICWIIIEVGSVVLPTFDAPEWIFRGAIIAAVVGFPVMLVLAWFFDVNQGGISLQADPTETVGENLGARKSDFAIIGVLVFALAVSLFLNVKNEAPVAAASVPIPVKIAAFDNQTGEPIFEGVLEEALSVGLEVAPHISVVDEFAAVGLAGAVRTSGDGYRIDLVATELANQSVIFERDEKAATQERVLQAIGELALDARKQLGDKTVGARDATQAETFAALTLTAANFYAAGRQQEVLGDVDAAIVAYRQASTADASLGRAISQLALLEFERGNTVAAEEHWQKALPLLESMTERERLRAMGRYFRTAKPDATAALALYTEFVDKYPADLDARRQLAALAARQLDFATARKQLREVLTLRPTDQHIQTQLALYAMAAGDWDTATAEAEQALAIDEGIAATYLPLAMAALADGQFATARTVYENMANDGGSALAQLGLADIDLFLGQHSAAQERLVAAIKSDSPIGNHLRAAQTLALAASYANEENLAAATSAAEAALTLTDDLSAKVLASMVFIRAGKVDTAQPLVDALAEATDSHSRAYAKMLEGLLLEREGATTDAIMAMRRAISVADLWLIRYEIGKAYFRAGNYPEALGELTTLNSRNGEAASVFLDAMPSYRLASELPYWTGRTQQELNMRAAARKSYNEYVAVRPNGGAPVQDARERAASLE